tara:strand:+ start:5172 stop:5510 length:339 start_codon:yes stop_codon:yes gene_type:complete
MATKYDLEITQGTKYSARIGALNDDGSVINLNGYSLSGQIRHSYGSTGKLLDLSLTPTAGMESSGHFDLEITAVQSSALPVVKGVYDIELHSGVYSSRLIYGYVNVYPEVTR